MSRFENLCIQCLMAVFLMLVIGGCAPGSAGSGTGPASSEPPTTSVPTPPGASPNTTAPLPIVPGENLITGLVFNSTDLFGRWVDVQSKTTIEITSQKIRLISPCLEFVVDSAWVAKDALAIQLSGNLISQASRSVGTAASSGPASLVLTLPAANQLYAQVIRLEGVNVLRLPSMVRVAADSPAIAAVCPN